MKKFYRSSSNKKIFGVCGGIGDVLGIDPTIIRVVWAAGALLFGIGIVLYILAALILKKNNIEVINCDVKKLYRSKTDKIIFGVCGGIAEYLDVDPFIVRFMFIVSVLCFGYGILTYLVAAFIIKYK